MTPLHPWNEGALDSIKARLPSLPHALLIHGPKGVGKLALAERVAQLLLCEARDPMRKPCGECEACRWFLSGNHPDFRRVEPEALAPQAPEAEDAGGEGPAKKGKPSQEIKVDQVRALADFLNIGSHRSGRRVALVHPAEEMNANSANALLKGLEEPPGGAMFVLVSHRPARLLPTIRSRCVAIAVSLPPREVALRWMAGQQTKDAERWLAYAGGAPLRALEYAAAAETTDRLIKAAAGRGQFLPDNREELEALAEALQKMALDQSLQAFGLGPKYSIGKAPVAASSARAWLAFAREMGPARALARHPLNPRLFGAEMLGRLPSK